MIERAKEIFKRYIGYEIGTAKYVERFHYNPTSGAVLRHSSFIRVVSIKAKASKWVYEQFFGDTDWVVIDVNHVVVHTKDEVTAVTVPPTLFGTYYSEVEIEYEAGLVDIPEDVVDAIQEIANLLENGQITEWNCTLPISVIDVIDKYRKEVDW